MLNVELAATQEQKMRGLMYREYIEESAGMLFLYSPPRNVSMWMKDTYIPLDMLFISEEGVVLEIHHNASPLSLTPITHAKPAAAVLEIAGGAAKRLGVVEGSRVEWHIE